MSNSGLHRSGSDRRPFGSLNLAGNLSKRQALPKKKKSLYLLDILFSSIHIVIYLVSYESRCIAKSFKNGVHSLLGVHIKLPEHYS
jgi:hypothetical protein